MAESRQPQPQPASKPSSPQQRAALIAAVLAGGAAGAAAVSAPVLTPAILAALTRLLIRWGYRRETIRHTLRVTTRLVSTPRGGPVGPGEAEAANARAEHTFSAWFLERSAERVERGYAVGAPEGEPEAREDRFIEQHLDAQERRRAAARRVDVEADLPEHVTSSPQGGRVILKWRAHPDDKTTPECAAADGAWFYADTPPIIGYPGMPHGGTCRCWPAHAGSLAEVARGRHVNEAVRAILEADHRQHPGASGREGRRAS